MSLRAFSVAARRVGAAVMRVGRSPARLASSFTEEAAAAEGGIGLGWWVAGLLSVLLASPVAVAVWGRRQHAQLRQEVLAWDPNDAWAGDNEDGAPPSAAAVREAAATARMRRLARDARLGVRVEYLALLLLRTWGVAGLRWYSQVLAHVATRQLDVDLLAAALDMHSYQWDAAARPLMAALGHAVSHQRLIAAASREGWINEYMRRHDHADGLAQLRRHGFYRRVALALDWLALAAPAASRASQGGSARPTSAPLLMEAALTQYPDCVLSPAAVDVAAAALGVGDHVAHVPLDQLLGAVVSPDLRQWATAAALQALEDGAVAPAAAHVVLGLPDLAGDALVALALRHAVAEAAAGGAGTPAAPLPAGGRWQDWLGGWGGEEQVVRDMPPVGRNVLVGLFASPVTVPIRLRVSSTADGTHRDTGEHRGRLSSRVAGEAPYASPPAVQRYTVVVLDDARVALRSALAEVVPELPGDRWSPSRDSVPPAVLAPGPVDAVDLGSMDELYCLSFALWPAPVFTAHPRTIAAMARQDDAIPLASAALSGCTGSEIDAGTGRMLDEAATVAVGAPSSAQAENSRRHAGSGAQGLLSAAPSATAGHKMSGGADGMRSAVAGSDGGNWWAWAWSWWPASTVVTSVVAPPADSASGSATTAPVGSSEAQAAGIVRRVALETRVRRIGVHVGEGRGNRRISSPRQRIHFKHGTGTDCTARVMVA